MMLCEAQVVEIYKLKIEMCLTSNSSSKLEDGAAGQKIRGRSISIAAQFRVSSRAIRDIWNRKTWAYATQHLWHLESGSLLNTHTVSQLFLCLLNFCELFWWLLSIQAEAIYRHPGRPKGSRDSKPRMKSHSTSQVVLDEPNIPKLMRNLETDLRLHEETIDQNAFGDPFHEDWLYW